MKTAHTIHANHVYKITEASTFCIGHLNDFDSDEIAEMFEDDQG